MGRKHWNVYGTNAIFVVRVNEHGDLFFFRVDLSTTIKNQILTEFPQKTNSHLAIMRVAWLATTGYAQSCGWLYNRAELRLVPPLFSGTRASRRCVDVEHAAAPKAEALHSRRCRRVRQPHILRQEHLARRLAAM